MHKLGIRKSTIVLTVITLTPIVILIIYLNFVQLRRSQELQIAELKNIAELIAAENVQIIEGARQLLITLSISPEVKNQNLCNTYLSNLLSKYERYGNLGIANRSGLITCSALPSSSLINLSDRYFFQKTIETNAFTVGEYVISKTTSKASINFGYPLPNSTGIVYATLELSWLSKVVENLEKDKNLVILILDRAGKILASSSGFESWTGKQFLNDKLPGNLNESNERFEVTDIDNIKRVYAIQKIGSLEAGPYVLVGQEKGNIFSGPNKDFEKILALSIITAFFSTLAGVYIGNSLISKIVQKISEVEGLKKDFISLISHQIRTPVTSIKWFVDILSSPKTGELNRKQKNLLRDIKLSTARITGLIKTLIDISKLESNKLPVNKERLSIKKLIDSTVREIKTNFTTKKIKTTTTFDKNFEGLVEADRKLLKQVFLNLIHNAYKYTDSGGKIKILVRKVRDKIRVEIKDTGIGVPDREKARLFQKFERATNARYVDTEGVGLGLYLAKLIVKAHGGTIGLGKTKKGTLIFFTIALT